MSGAVTSEGDTVSPSGGRNRQAGSSSSYGSLGTSVAEESPLQRTSFDAPENGPPPHTNAFIYCSHFLSAWGDRMWSFGVGLFLVRIAGNQLQLPAIYGLSSGLAIFVLGALVGDWVDSTPRLKAAQVSLVTQNLLVAVCAGGVYAYLRWEGSLVAEAGGWAVPLCQAAVIGVAVLGDLASMARVIAVEKDWIVQICGQDTDMLARMTATLRRIDQTTLIVAPAATGQVMTYAGLEVGALFIGVWNVCSVLLEYYLMWKVYTTVPALASRQSGIGGEEEAPLIREHNKTTIKPPPSATSSTNTTTTAETEITLPDPEPDHPSSDSSPTLPPPPTRSPSQLPFRAQPSPAEEARLVVKTTPQWNESSRSFRTDLVGTIDVDTEILLDDSADLCDGAGLGGSQSGGGGGGRCAWWCSRACQRFSALYEGWRQYKKYTVALAGLALSFLYMTVLGFDNITVAYAVTQGVSESILGIMMAVSAIFGMIGTFIYPIWRRRVGLIRTGMLALSCQVCCLSLCVVSIWMPGSPFDPTYSRLAVPAASLMPNASGQTTTWSTMKTSQPSLSTQEAEDSTLLYFSPTSPFPTSPDATPPPAAWSEPRGYSSTQAPPFLDTNSTDSIITPERFTMPSTITTDAPLMNFPSPEDVRQMTAPSLNFDKFNNISLVIFTPSENTKAETVVEGGQQMTTFFETTSSPGTQVNIFTERSTVTVADQTTSSSSPVAVSSTTPVGSSPPPVTDSTPAGSPSSSEPSSYVSVSLFLAGIVLARFGLWTADLAITQQFLEEVREGERGAVNGVQSSLNKLMDVLKFLLVVLIPDTQTFGFLILVSFSFICAAWVLYAVFLRKARGHFLPTLLRCQGGAMDYATL
ncbi:ferroportin-like [Babylonia areolata]|uniref:ferroportin-like n=1 Tax=Babylonia areolata TaxID=304850 RepID=UPI003FD310F8